MVLESTVICIDNSEFMRNGDFIPNRLQVQQDAVNLVCQSKTRSNPENNVGLITLSSGEVLVTLTTDSGKIMSKLHNVQPKGYLNFSVGVKIAHLCLKHRQGKNHKMRLIVFVGSPVTDDEKELVKLAKRLKKEKVNVDIVNFGQEADSTEKLSTFLNTINGKEGTSCHLVTVPAGTVLSDALLSSPIVMGEDGSVVPGLGSSDFEFGVDPTQDPELALALRVSMEEQRQRQEEESRQAATASMEEMGVTTPSDTPSAKPAEGGDEEALLERALQMSRNEGPAPRAMPDVTAMSEEEQIAYAMQLSMQSQGVAAGGSAEDVAMMESDDKDEGMPEEGDDYSDVINDPAFLQSVLENLPGVDPGSDAIRHAMDMLTQSQPDDDDDDDEDDDQAKDKDKEKK